MCFIFSFYFYPQTAADVVTSYSKFAHILIAVSVGMLSKLKILFYVETKN